jgi:Kef-type K+ transport system membrane component KefB
MNRPFETNCHLKQSNVQETDMRVIGDFLFLILFFMLIGLWLVMWIGFHLAGGAIHLLLIIALISLILHLFRRRTA